LSRGTDVKFAEIHGTGAGVLFDRLTVGFDKKDGMGLIPSSSGLRQHHRAE
jgi:hypothetical protein